MRPIVTRIVGAAGGAAASAGGFSSSRAESPG
jgi:hypothetical protein